MVIEKEKCTGCGACRNICPVSCIDMVSDSEGFLYPSIDLSNCTNCGMCKRVCPVVNGIKSHNNLEPNAYAAWSLDEDIRFNSTSGGIFTELARQVISQGGYIAGARYNDKHLVEHYIINDEEDISLLRQSKYVQSDSKDIYKKVKEVLDKDKVVMFVGTPCQCAGLASFLDKKYDKLLICDFICRGVNSPKAYMKYLESLEEEYNAPIKKVWFKNKINGWNKFCTKIEFENGKEYYADRYTDLFMVGYLKYNLYMRPSCSNCNFKGFPRCSDITLADFWGVELEDKKLDIEKGTSLVIENSEKGKYYFKQLEERIFKQITNLESALIYNRCAIESIIQGRSREIFFSKIDSKGFSQIIKEFIRI